MDNSVKKQKKLTPLAWVAKLMVLVAVFNVVSCGCKDKGQQKLSMTGNNISGKDRKAKVTIKNEGEQELDLAATNVTFEAKITIKAKSGQQASNKECKVGSHSVKVGSSLNKALKEIIGENKISAGGTKDVEIEFAVDPAKDESATAELTIKDGAGKEMTSYTVKLESIT